MSLPEFHVPEEEEDFLKADNVVTLRNAHCFKERDTGLVKMTVDRWGKIVHDVDSTLEEVNLDKNFSIPIKKKVEKEENPKE